MIGCNGVLLGRRAFNLDVTSSLDYWACVAMSGYSAMTLAAAGARSAGVEYLSETHHNPRRNAYILCQHSCCIACYVAEVRWAGAWPGCVGKIAGCRGWAAAAGATGCAVDYAQQ